MQKAPRLFRPTDALIPILLIAVALLLVFLPFLSENDGSLAMVRYGDETVYLPLDTDTDRTFESNGYRLTLSVRNGEVFVSDSNCPDGTCRHMGHIARRGESILCTKAALSVTITDGKGDFDAVAR